MDHHIHPDFSRCALLTIDMQNDFALPGAVAEVKGTCDIIPGVKKILTICRLAKVPIFHVIRIYQQDGSNADLCRRAMIESGATIVKSGSHGVELVRQLQPEENCILHFDALLKGAVQTIAEKERILYKPRWGAFYQTALEACLWKENINTLLFTGCNFPNCPRTSIYEASERDFKIVMIKDAISGLYDKGVAEMENIGVMVLNTADAIQCLKDKRSISIP